MVALGVVAFRDGGVAAVGIVTAARMAAAALLAPLLATVADRVRRERVLACVGLIRAVALGGAAAVIAAGRPGRGRLRPRRRRHGRAGAVPAGALGAAARVVHLAAAADARERRPRHARLARHARRARRRGGPAGGERAGGRLRGVRGRVAAGRPAGGRRCRTTRRRAPRPPAAPVARSCRGSPTIAADRRLALITALGFVQTFTRGCLTVFAVVVAIELLRHGGSRASAS